MYKLRVLFGFYALLISIAYGQGSDQDTCVIKQNCIRNETQIEKWTPCGQSTSDDVNVHNISNPDW